MNGKDLGRRPSVLGKTIFEYSSLGEVLADNVKKKTNTDKVNIKEKKLIYNSQYSFTKFKDIYVTRLYVQKAKKLKKKKKVQSC